MNHHRVRNLAALWLVVSIALSGCAIRLVADYDSGTFDEVLKAEKEVDLFYGNLLETPQKERSYSRYAGQYVSIETDLRLLVTRNKSRPLNQESTSISETILKLWVKYKEKHQADNGYSDGNAKLDRARFTRLFRAAASAEEAKKLEQGDR